MLLDLLTGLCERILLDLHFHLEVMVVEAWCSCHMISLMNAALCVSFWRFTVICFLDIRAALLMMRFEGLGLVGDRWGF